MAKVDVSPATVTSLKVAFTEAMAAQSAIDDGSIVNAVSLVDVSKGPVPMATSQFAYVCGTQTLTLSFDQPLPAATYELHLNDKLQLNGGLLTDTDGNPLRGGSSGLVLQLPELAAAETLQAGGTTIDVGSYSVPSLADWNGDGLVDLIVGEKTAGDEGKIRVYLNTVSNTAPVYGTYFYAQSGGADLAVSAAGCMGVFPRVFDWNQDGRKDLVLGMPDGTVKVAFNENSNSEPHFGVPQPVKVGQPGSKIDIDVGKRATLAIVDWNNDQRYDLVLGDLDGNVRVLLNKANSGPADFRSETMALNAAAGLGVPDGRASVAVADLNGDGRKDLVVGNTKGQLFFYPNIGTDAEPRFDGYVAIQADGAAVDLAGDPRSRPFVGDANGDGRLDVFVGAQDGLVRLFTALTAPKETDGPQNNEGEPGETYTHTFRVVPPWQSPTHKNDVDGDGRITVLDVLALVNHLTANGPQELPVPPVPPNAPPPYLDCNGDGNVSTLDVLQVVIDLGTFGPRALAEGEGEGEGTWPVYVGGSPSSEAEGEAPSQSSLAKTDSHPEQEPQPLPEPQPQQANHDEHDDNPPTPTLEDVTTDASDLEEALSEIASSLGQSGLSMGM